MTLTKCKNKKETPRKCEKRNTTRLSLDTKRFDLDTKDV